ncbi:MAG: hypothetical protein RMJ17_01230 [Candidatus Aenigmarchaeota archaeon]|nr:hypothetical protein [Candidatus Aenigmarchaeota archaeon]MDW8149206.1 hypothetical protein [Candidatus Aenigmarchaeota archaeon]
MEKLELTANEIETPRKFKMYNTNGTLPYSRNGKIIMSGTMTLNSYQGIISLVSLRAKKDLILEAVFNAKITKISDNPENEFAIFVSNDIVNWKKEEFGVVIRLINETKLKYYVQSPQLADFFVEFDGGSIKEKNYVKIKYTNSRIKVFLDGKLVRELDFVDIWNEKFYLVVSLKNLDGSDFVGNFFEIEKVILKNFEEYDILRFTLVLFLIIVIVPVIVFSLFFRVIMIGILKTKLKMLERKKALLEDAYFKRRIDKELFSKEMFKVQEEIKKINDELAKLS